MHFPTRDRQFNTGISSRLSSLFQTEVPFMQQTQTKVDQRWIGLIFIALSLLVVSINDTILNVSLPIIARELNASTSDLQWIQNAYLLVFASLLLTMGTLSDRYGRKRFLLIGVAAFSIFSLIAGLS
ncbi:MAG: MFS transporter [Phycisphaerae bacterium]|nr:MFS transporter [Phycisphaerae bacterium]